MKLTILGNNGPYPSKDGACSGYLLQSDSGETNVLIECGTGVLARLLGALPLERLDAVLLSHLHFDHMSDMLPMQYALQFSGRRRMLDVYAPERPEPVRALLESSYTDVWPLENTVIGEMQIAVCNARHPVPTKAISVTCDGRRFVFTGDSNTEPEVELFADGADLLLADAGLSTEDHRDSAPHYSAALCGRLAKDVRAKALLLTHFNPKYDREVLLREARAYYPGAMLSEQGKTYYI